MIGVFESKGECRARSRHKINPGYHSSFERRYAHRRFVDPVWHIPRTNGCVVSHARITRPLFFSLLFCVFFCFAFFSSYSFHRNLFIDFFSSDSFHRILFMELFFIGFV
ncbi:uncharacterized protein BDZ99DRAFT_168779 [Mytilinidion resinicola]|uniref:Uncharacterized protein n=1 Tax=Mytilinidion resinicola TaxID=574789 RepID=A0A6A6Y492_9PEZI|nr:uncharacterized protein BDZ99DRAFT_168779 [Mytilinidion resinicola]KAF2803661.1 hypothetical protein BDZ99DRAFT_168779 [Mytilinidion resinicola]